MRKALTWVAVFVLAPLVIGGTTFAYRLISLEVTPAPSFPLEARPAPAVEGRRPSAVILLGNGGTEGSDFLVPFEILSRTGAFEVLVAAPHRRISPLMPASIDVIPDYALAELDAALGGRRPDLIVLPYLPNAHAEDLAVLEWLRRNTGEGTLVLTICGGSEVLARAGLLDGRTATSHHNLIGRLEEDFPEVEWMTGLRWVDDGDIVSSGAILSGFDATLHVVRRMLGEDVARRVAAELRYPYVHFLDAPRYQPIEAPLHNSMLNVAFRWRLPVVGVPISDGVLEVALAAVIDTYPHSFAVRLESYAGVRRVYRSFHGLQLVPRKGGATAADYSWTVAPESAYADGEFVFEASLRDMALRFGRDIAEAAAWGLGYPVEDASLAGPTWPLDPMGRPLLISLAAVLMWRWLRRVRQHFEIVRRPGAPGRG